MSAEIYYGKGHVTMYRTYATPLDGVLPIPESTFTGRTNTLFAADIDVQVFGNNFLPAYTEGDNSMVVATDTMKNFILRESLQYRGATLEGLLEMLGQRFLGTYPQMEWVRMTGHEIPFQHAMLPTGNGTVEASPVLLAQSLNDRAMATLDIVRDGDGFRVTDHRCGLMGMKPVKVTGSAFAGFDRDEYTTLAERPDRLLFIYLDVFWRYASTNQMLGTNHAHYIPAEQVRDVVLHTFHALVSMSIQHLIYEMGKNLLNRFPQMSEVSFAAQNRLWDTASVSESNSRIKAYTDPRPGYGSLGLTLHRDEL